MTSKPPASQKNQPEMAPAPTQDGMRKGLTSYGDAGFSLFLRKAFIKGAGFTDTALDRPVIGITNTGSAYNPCHGNAPQLIEAVKRGVMMVELDFALEIPGEDAYALAVIRLLDKLTMPRQRIVRLVGSLARDDAMFTLLVNMLHDHGYNVEAVVSGKYTAMWFKWLKWLVVATGEDVIPFKANELWYAPGELRDPIFPAGAQDMLLTLQGRFGVEELEDFLAKSAYAWAVKI